MYKSLRKFPKFHYLIIAGVLLFVFSLIYFFYLQARDREEIYLSIRLNGESTPVPYWVANSVNVGDIDADPYGNIRVEVIDKESYEGGGDGVFVQLLIKVFVLRNKSGLYLYKNKPLSVGGEINLRFPKISQSGYIYYIDNQPHQANYKKFILTLEGRDLSPLLIENLKVDSKIVNNKGRVLARVLDKNVYDDIDNKKKKSVKLKVEILAEKISNHYYFQRNQKVKVGETLDLHLTDVSLWDLKIISIKE